ncbi:sugar transferase [bacterium]|nr:sugar transferase [bacterium]
MTVSRVLELLAVFFLFVVFFVPFIMLAVLLQIDSAGPILFADLRYGKGKRPFYMYKLRSMKRGEDGTTPYHTTDRDSRFSRFAHFVRSTGLDELPQIFNVMKGEMALIGPRPERVFVVDKYYSGWMEDVFEFTPGICGVTQLVFRGMVFPDEFPDKLALELWYARNRTFLSDVALLCYTVVATTSFSWKFYFPSSQRENIEIVDKKLSLFTRSPFRESCRAV